MIDDIFVMFDACGFQQTDGKNYAPLLVAVFLYSYEADFIQGVFKENYPDPLISRSAI